MQFLFDRPIYHISAAVSNNGDKCDGWSLNVADITTFGNCAISTGWYFFEANDVSQSTSTQTWRVIYYRNGQLMHSCDDTAKPVVPDETLKKTGKRDTQATAWYRLSNTFRTDSAIAPPKQSNLACLSTQNRDNIKILSSHIARFA